MAGWATIRQGFGILDNVSRAGAYLVGGLAIMLALASFASGNGLGAVTDWAWRVLGATFMTLLAALVFTALFCWVKLGNEDAEPAATTWLTAGVQAANGIATLALTYTLLGISLGIGSLAGQELTPETVQGVIQGLTAAFSMAFMTTIIGLPTSALLRALLLVSASKRQETQPPEA